MNNQNAFIPAPYPVSDAQARIDKPVLIDDSKMETKMDTISGRNEAAFNESINDDTKDKADTTIDQDERYIEDLDGCVVCVSSKIFRLLRLIITLKILMVVWYV